MKHRRRRLTFSPVARQKNPVLATSRTQLTLLVPEPAASVLEEVRRRVDPAQAALVPAHVTLAREDELTGLDAVRARLRAGRLSPLTLVLGCPEIFGGHGLLLPCTGGRDAYHALRSAVLGAGARGEATPHLTLAHPRNVRAPGNALLETRGLPGAMRVTFRAVHLVEQAGEGPWRKLERFALAG